MDYHEINSIEPSTVSSSQLKKTVKLCNQLPIIEISTTNREYSNDMNNNNNNTPSSIRKVEEGVEQEEQDQEDRHSKKQFQKQSLKCTATKSNRYYYGNKYNDSLKDSNRIIPTNEIALFMRRKRVYYPPHFKLIPPSSGGWEEVIPERVIDWDKTFDLQDDYYSSFLYVHTKEGPLDIPWNKSSNKEKYVKKNDHYNQKDQQQEMNPSLNVNVTTSTSPTSTSSSCFSSSSSPSLSSPSSSSSSSSSTFSTNESICSQDQTKIKNEDTTTTTTLLSPPPSHQYHHSKPSNKPALTISTSQDCPLLLDNVTQENKKDTISLATPLKSLSSFNESKSDQYLNHHKKEYSTNHLQRKYSGLMKQQQTNKNTQNELPLHMSSYVKDLKNGNKTTEPPSLTTNSNEYISYNDTSNNNGNSHHHHHHHNSPLDANNNNSHLSHMVSPTSTFSPWSTHLSPWAHNELKLTDHYNGKNQLNQLPFSSLSSREREISSSSSTSSLHHRTRSSSLDYIHSPSKSTLLSSSTGHYHHQQQQQQQQQQNQLFINQQPSNSSSSSSLSWRSHSISPSSSSSISSFNWPISPSSSSPYHHHPLPTTLEFNGQSKNRNESIPLNDHKNNNYTYANDIHHHFISLQDQLSHNNNNNNNNYHCLLSQQQQQQLDINDRSISILRVLDKDSNSNNSNKNKNKDNNNNNNNNNNMTNYLQSKSRRQHRLYYSISDYVLVPDV